jgi:hypothetical protein
MAIVLAATLALNGRVAEPTPHYCLRLVREIVEHALGWEPYTFYAVFWTHTVEENRTAEPWARDLERSMRAAGLSVPTPIAGDLVFNHNLGKPYGHAGVMLTQNLVLDVWPDATGPPLRLTPVAEWAPTTIIRITEEAAHADLR